MAIPVRRPGPGRRPPRRGQRLAGLHAGSARAIHVAVNRRAYGASGREGEEAFLPEHALTLERAFAAYTSGSARINHRDDAGSLRPGAVADLVVLDRDPFVGPPEEIGATRVRSTWIDGQVVATNSGALKRRNRGHLGSGETFSLQNPLRCG